MLISDILREQEDDELCYQRGRERRRRMKKTRIHLPSFRWLPLRSFLRYQSSAPPPAAAVEEGRNPRERVHLGVGMGAGLVMLLTRSSSEFRKMAALRKEMESLMEDCKTAIQKNSQNPNPNLTSCGGSDSRAETEQSNLTDDASHGGDAERWRRRRPLMREEMEAELESELELLHINLVKQEVSGEGSAPYGSSTAGLESEEQGEEEEEEEKAVVEIAGVSPRALTRKLHELLERRQQERIEELESDLELARAKLREKEMEISLWRETARVVSQRAVSHTQRII